MTTKKMWGGRFKKKTDSDVERFTKSIDYDYKLAKYDVYGSLLHVFVLNACGFLTKEEEKSMSNALRKIYNDIVSGKFKYNKRSEDIHTDIQNKVEKEVGPLSLKLHTARSRNDQVLFDLKLFCRDELLYVGKLCKELQNSILEICEEHKETFIPGYTHLQHAQIVRLKDYLGSYAEMFKRDLDRLDNTRERIRLTLGSGALAGTPIGSTLYQEMAKKFVREHKELKEIFSTEHIDKVSNTLDTVSDRDFVIEVLSVLSIMGMHLSRFAEDLIIWSTKEFGFVEIDDAFATGSSLMPQKKNPDVLELIRAYTGTLYGNLMSVLTMMKGLPLTYNRDMQLDKPPLFSSFEIIEQELKIFPKLIKTLKWNKKTIEKAIENDETLYATDLVYYLIKKGIAFKQAHDIIGKLIKFSLDSSRKIKEMSNIELKRFSDRLKQEEIVKLLDPETSVKSRESVVRTSNV
ncbi:MAG: argininosuccinate lyase [Candidatus Omnitrophica bacterium]|nr:argininosuccinate lyase [Candidatus Omnitrophota bacterium]